MNHSLSHYKCAFSSPVNAYLDAWDQSTLDHSGSGVWSTVSEDCLCLIRYEEKLHTARECGFSTQETTPFFHSHCQGEF